MSIASPTALFRRATALPLGLADRIDSSFDSKFSRLDTAFDRLTSEVTVRGSSLESYLHRCADSLDLALDQRVSKADSRAAKRVSRIVAATERIGTAVAKLESRIDSKLNRQLRAVDRAVDATARLVNATMHSSIALTHRVDNKITRVFNRFDVRTTNLVSRAHHRQTKTIALALRTISNFDRKIDANLLRADVRVANRLGQVVSTATATTNLVNAKALAFERVMESGIARVDSKITSGRASGVAGSVAISKSVYNFDQLLTGSVTKIENQLENRLGVFNYRYSQMAESATRGIATTDEKLDSSLAGFDLRIAGTALALDAAAIEISNLATNKIESLDRILNRRISRIDDRTEVLVDSMNGGSRRHASHSRKSVHRMATALTLVLGTLGAATAASATSASQEPAEVDVALKYESSAAKEAVTQYLNVRESFQALQASRSRTIQTLEQEIAAAKVRLSQTSLDGNAIIDFADNYSGVPYVRGGTTPRGFDCSGFTSYVFAHFGLELPRTSQEQRAWADPVSFEDRQVGDLMFWQYGSIRHVAIYAGDGKMWDSPRPGRRVGKVVIWGNPTYGRVPASAINGPAQRELEAKSAELKDLIDNAPQLPITIDEKNLIKEAAPEVPATATN